MVTTSWSKKKKKVTVSAAVTKCDAKNEEKSGGRCWNLGWNRVEKIVQESLRRNSILDKVFIDADRIARLKKKEKIMLR